MTEKEQKIAIEKGIESLTYFVKNADHSNESSIDLIFGSDLSEEELDYILDETKGFESFSPVQDANTSILSIEHLYEMLSDLKSLLAD
ncbi:hypothetical protein D3C85_948260 [compost metagenome]